LNQRNVQCQNMVELTNAIPTREASSFLLIFHYGLDHGLHCELYLKLIMQSNCWLLQVEKGR
jgi:hypothetical protein